MTPYEFGKLAALGAVPFGEEHPYIAAGLDGGLTTANEGHRLRAMGASALGMLAGGFLGGGAGLLAGERLGMRMNPVHSMETAMGLGLLGGTGGAVAGSALAGGPVIEDSYSTENKLKNILG